MNRVAVLIYFAGVCAGTMVPAVGADGTNTVDIAAQTAAVEAQARFLSLTKREADFLGRKKMLLELADLHTARAESARNGGQPELARWENDLVREYQTRAAKLDQDAVAVGKERSAAEQAKTGGAVQPSGTDSALYLAKLQERTWDTEQQLATLAEVTALYTSQLQTNNTPEHVARVSDQIDQFARDQRFLRRDLMDLELRRLEFKALRSNP